MYPYCGIIMVFYIPSAGMWPPVQYLPRLATPSNVSCIFWLEIETRFPAVSLQVSEALIQSKKIA